MPSFLEMFAPQWTEMQRARARQQFQAGLQQPELFQIDQMPIPQMVQAYEKGYGMPYPTQQATSIPLPGGGGMATDPNVPTPPENMPVEYVQPRSLEESSLRTAGIQGRAGMEGKISGLEYAGGQMPRLEGFFEDAGEDIGEYGIPESLGGFQRKEQTGPEGEPMVNIPGYGMLPASVGYRYLQDPKGGDKADIMVDPDQEGPLPAMPSQHAYHYMQKPGTGEEIPAQVKSALSYFQAMARQQGLDPKDAVLLALRPQLAEQIKQSMDPQAKQLYDTMAMIVQKYFSDYAGQTGATDPMGIR